MAGFLFRLETEDGAPAEPRQLTSAVPNWGAGDTIHLGKRMLQVVALRDVDGGCAACAGGRGDDLTGSVRSKAQDPPA